LEPVVFKFSVGAGSDNACGEAVFGITAAGGVLSVGDGTTTMAASAVSSVRAGMRRKRGLRSSSLPLSSDGFFLPAVVQRRENLCAGTGEGEGDLVQAERVRRWRAMRGIGAAGGGDGERREQTEDVEAWRARCLVGFYQNQISTTIAIQYQERIGTLAQ
jgi:hypothetical protein